MAPNARWAECCAIKETVLKARSLTGKGERSEERSVCLRRWWARDLQA